MSLGRNMLMWLKKIGKGFNWRAGAAIVLAAVVFVSVLVIMSAGWVNKNNNGQFALSNGQNHFSVRWMGYLGPGKPDYYVCINDLASNTLEMYVDLEIKNQEDSGYYFTVEPFESAPAGWTVPVQYVGLINKDQTTNFDYAMYRTKPSSIPEGRITEKINLAVKAYYDASYSQLYSFDNFTVTFHLIDRTASVWTILYHDSFDDGTTQGWSGIPSPSVSTDYYRSFRYSLKLYTYMDGYYYKSFNIPTNYNEAYLIFSLRSNYWGNMRILLDNVEFYRPDAQLPTDTWLQFCVSLPTEPPETTLVKIYAIGYTGNYRSAYLDDVYVIAK